MTSRTESPQHTSVQSQLNKLISQVQEQQVKIQDLTTQLESLSQKKIAQVQEHSPVIKLIARLHEQRQEIESLQVSITASHKEKEILVDSLKREQNLNMLNFSLL